MPQLRKGSKSVEQKLFEAFQTFEGVTLSPMEVVSLCRDDAIGTRITNQACREAGIDQAEGDEVSLSPTVKTWDGFKKKLKKNAGEPIAAKESCRGCCASIGGKGPLCQSCRIASRIADSDHK